jgi:hypothetical protein
MGGAGQTRAPIRLARISGNRTSRESFNKGKTTWGFRLQGKEQGLVRGFQKLKADPLTARGWNLFHISSVHLRQQDAGNTGSFG